MNDVQIIEKLASELRKAMAMKNEPMLERAERNNPLIVRFPHKANPIVCGRLRMSECTHCTKGCWMAEIPPHYLDITMRVQPISHIRPSVKKVIMEGNLSCFLARGVYYEGEVKLALKKNPAWFPVLQRFLTEDFHKGKNSLPANTVKNIKHYLKRLGLLSKTLQ